MPPRSLEPLRPLNPARYEEALEGLERARDRLGSRAVWHVNFSGTDSVAELLRSLLSYSRCEGINTNWLGARIDGFAPLARRMYHRLYGTPGDGEPLGTDEAGLLGQLTDTLAPALLETVRSGDIVYLHDPPSAGLVAVAREAGARVVWRCHVGTEAPNEYTEDAWDFLRPLVADADRIAFTRDEYVWDGLPAERVRILHPSLDPFTPKNQLLPGEAVQAAIAHMGLVKGRAGVATFTRLDGSQSRIDDPVTVDQDGPVPAGAPVVAQVSGWERLKDPAGLIDAFAAGCSESPAHLLVVGPAVAGSKGTTEEPAALEDARTARLALPAALRERVHLLQLPIDDLEENAAMVNAVQRWADVVVHKSLREAFGLSVAEAMWKARPVVASDIAGIRTQVVPDESGVLADPNDHGAFGREIELLLGDPGRRDRLGTAANARIRDEFLVTRQLVDYVELLGELAED